MPGALETTIPKYRDPFGTRTVPADSTILGGSLVRFPEAIPGLRRVIDPNAHQHAACENEDACSVESLLKRLKDSAEVLVYDQGYQLLRSCKRNVNIPLGFVSSAML